MAQDVLEGVWDLIKNDLGGHIPSSKQYIHFKNSARYASQNLFNQKSTDGLDLVILEKLMYRL